MLTHLNQSSTLPQRVVVLGAGGFVGKKLVEALQAKKINVWGVERKDCDLLDKQAQKILADQLQAGDSLVFLSAITPDKGKGVQAFQDNITIANSVYEALKLQPISHILLISSEAIFPMTPDLLRENSSFSPPDLYGLMHLTRERLFETLNAPLAVLRSTLIYGPGDTHNSYGPNRFLKEAMSQQTITLFGKGEEKRSHIYVDDIVELITKVLLQKSIGTLNMCPAPTISFFEVANKIAESLQDDVKILEKPGSSEITHRYFDNANLYQAFPDFCFTDFEQGVRDTIRNIRK